MKVLAPTSLDDACRMMAQEEGLVPMAGATDLLVHWPTNLRARDRTYIDLWGLDELRGHAWTDDELTLGALTTYWDIVTDPLARESFPMLVQAARQVGAVQIQARGTWAGNIVNASPAADGVPVLMAHDAVVDLVSASGERTIRLDAFYSGYKQMDRRADELVRAIRVPRRKHDVQVFEKVGSRRAQTISKVGLAIAHSSEGWRVVAASMAPTVCRCPSVEAMLEAESPVLEPEEFLGAIDADVTPIDDIRSNASYRRLTMARVLYHALRPHCSWIGA